MNFIVVYNVLPSLPSPPLSSILSPPGELIFSRHAFKEKSLFILQQDPWGIVFFLHVTGGAQKPNHSFFCVVLPD